MEKTGSDATKKLIADATIQLMKNKKLNKISVREIAEASNITRQTFYYHFEDIFDLIQWIYRNEVLGLFNNMNGDSLWKEGLLRLLEYLEENRDAILCILNSLTRAQLKSLFYDDIYNLMVTASDSVAQILQSNTKKNSPDYDEFLVYFYSISISSLIEAWAWGDIQMSPQELVDQLDRLIQDQITGVRINETASK